MATAQDMIDWFNPKVELYGTMSLEKELDALNIRYEVVDEDEDDDQCRLDLDDPADFGKVWKNREPGSGNCPDIDNWEETNKEENGGGYELTGFTSDVGIHVELGDISDPDEIAWLEGWTTFYINEDPVNSYDNKFAFPADFTFYPDTEGWISRDAFDDDDLIYVASDGPFFNWDEDKGDYVPEGDPDEDEDNDGYVAWFAVSSEGLLSRVLEGLLR